jgi:hypothetical protein
MRNPDKKRPDTSFVNEQETRMRELLQVRKDLPRDDLEYTVERISSLKDDRLKSCVASLIGWGDDDRAEVETFLSIAIEVLRKTPMSRIREAARIVEIRHLIKEATT